jgi:ribosomal protein L29
MNHPDYNHDFDLWLRAQAALLRERKLDLVDVDNLAEEVEGMTRAEHRELGSRLEILLIHLLKLKFQPNRRSNSWLGTIREQRRQIGRLLRDSPSMSRRVGEYAEREYPGAVQEAARQTGLPASTFPDSNPFNDQQLLDIEPGT